MTLLIMILLTRLGLQIAARRPLKIVRIRTSKSEAFTVCLTDGAGPEQPVAVPAGYCQHGTTIFSTWHRPYCALMEQTINRHATDIAAVYKVNREEWQKTAAKLRHPYWDWALHPLPHKEFYDHRQFSQVTITLPDGTSEPVDNPLLAYRVHSGKGPQPPTDPSIRTQHRTSIAFERKTLQRQFKRTRQDIATLLLEVHDWFEFGTQAARSGSSTNSLEALHGTLHVRIGDGGHINIESSAAFDPIFWLHHCNVDRVVALWQAINYEQWISPQNDSDLTWVTNLNSLVDSNSQLAPFWNSQTSFWTSTQCRNWTALHYTYPEFDGLNMTDAAAVLQRRKPHSKFNYRLLSLVEYFMVYGLPKLRRERGYIMEGFIHITGDLIQRGIDIMDASSVERYLQENLKWAIQTSAGEYRKVEDLKSLEVTVIDTPLYGSEGADIPVISGVRKHNEVTFDKPGGRVRVPGHASAHT
ncbi:hypothetical protein M407DRAFT_225885 [Tulasnella calospora MUT 4182]|uniref:tyrosinase n=1 Tax=Tulasnella calospora MUT 4182 TaxID=1051891 RepID=A0A0C3Q5J6_9AGAM|nr:hypothetical protein M407DRAFT_225885 [Tulasnella calospora MUT 4182]